MKTRLSQIQIQRIIELRNKHGMTLREIAPLIPTSKNTVHRVLGGAKRRDILQEEEHLDEEDVIVRSDMDNEIITRKGVRYRRFPADATQDQIYHYIFDQRDLKKIRIGRKDWYVEIKDHFCHINCVDGTPFSDDHICNLCKATRSNDNADR